MAPLLRLAAACALGAPALLSQASAPGGDGELHLSVSETGTLRAQVKVANDTEWVVLFYRREGETEFEALRLDLGQDGTFAADLEEVMPAGFQVQFFAALRERAGVRTLPAGAPTEFFSRTLTEAVTPESPEPAPPPAASPHGPIYLDASVTHLAHRKVTYPGEPTLLAAGQIRTTFQMDEGERHLYFSSRLVYTNQPAGNQARWSIGDIQATFGAGNHRLQAGDLMVQESEFTLGGGGRRGLDYTYAGRPLGGHLFALNTQRQVGVTGLVWPVEGSEAYGGSLSYQWFGNTLSTKLIFLTGRDDPSTAANMVTAYAAPVREGSTGALVLDGRFLENRLAISGEYARSLFTKDALDAAPKERDQAWRLGSQWNQGPFSAQAGYRAVGRDFGTVGVSFFVGDRRVFDGSLGLNYLNWGLTATATDERTNPTGQVNQNQAWNQTQSLDARVAITPTVGWRVGLRAARQESEIVANPFIPFSNSERAGLGTGFDLALPPHAMLTFNAQFDRIHATGYSDSTGTSTTLSVGGNLNLADWGRLSPNLSWSRVLSQPGDQRTTVTNAFLNAEFSLIPRILGLLLNGGVSRTLLSTGAILNTATAESTLGLTLDAFFQDRLRGHLGLKGRYTRNPALVGTVEDNRVILLLNLSF